MTLYQKPYLTVADQLRLLEQRGIVITDHARAEVYLARIGYYRLSAYWYPFRSRHSTVQPDGSTITTVEDTFKPGTNFQTVVDLYLFDKGLRLLMLDAFESIEIALRTAITLQIGQYDPWSYRDPQYFDGKFVNHANPMYCHAAWLRRFDEKATQSKETFAEHFRHKYPASQFPIWMAAEMLDFGALSHLLSGLRYSDQQQIARQCSIPRPQLLTSWVRMLSFVRNVCAHHARLWNKPLVDQPRFPQRGEVAELDHLLSIPLGNTRLYAAVAISRFLLKTINPSTDWHERLKCHIATFPDSPYISFSTSGFPDGWENESLWTF